MSDINAHETLRITEFMLIMKQTNVPPVHLLPLDQPLIVICG